eukprot:TRINITY_DN8124_c0_g1_i1.p1 TRINITY_DN8124_c0_g1~~TRINITY_DN8124_c0_g1_i1.p1  ORF type:complete len:144 (-),score=23.37 TRINITY_DN8124_c0_g1_i1:65-496(-)
MEYLSPCVKKQKVHQNQNSLHKRHNEEDTLFAGNLNEKKRIKTGESVNQGDNELWNSWNHWRLPLPPLDFEESVEKPPNSTTAPEKKRELERGFEEREGKRRNVTEQFPTILAKESTNSPETIEPVKRKRETEVLPADKRLKH